MKTDLTNIKNIIFDLGKVLVNLDFDATIKAFYDLAQNEEIIDSQHSYTDPVFYNLEVGKIVPEEFLKRIRELLNNPNATDLQINDAWYAMFKGVPADRVKLLQKLGKKYNLYLFSNTNELHIGKFLPDFKAQHKTDFTSLFIKTFYSHEIHERKPDVSAYLKVIELSGVKPEETLFIDDLENNIEGAKQAGLKTFWLKEGMELAELF
ncbi:MAG: HAD family phosphatase [Bacteroidota bacterium]